MERAICVTVSDQDVEESIVLELEELAFASGAEVKKHFIQKLDAFNPTYIMGIGKAKEIASFVKEYDIDTVIMNQELSGSQLRNLEEILKTKVLDRTTLILDIFALRARSKEGQLQVKLAQLEYRLPRIIGFSDYLSRTGGGIGTRGPGEQKLETDRRHVLREINSIKRELQMVKKNRGITRNRRLNSNKPVVALVGYTNAGKSTIMNGLMKRNAPVLTKDMLFASLDPSFRQAKLSNGIEYILVDTVGFVSNLPHDLVAAFESTLEELKFADIIVHVIDSSSKNYDLQIQTTYDVMERLEVLDKPIISVFNKKDLSQESPHHPQLKGPQIWLSATYLADLEKLNVLIEEVIMREFKKYHFVLPYENFSHYNFIKEQGQVLYEENEVLGKRIMTLMRPEDYQRIKNFILV